MKNGIIEAQKEHKKENVEPSRSKVANNASGAKNDALFKLTQYLAQTTKEVQGLELIANQ